MDSSDLVKVIDASMDAEAKITGKEPAFSTVEVDTAVNIFGKQCNIFKISWQSGQMYYYFCNNFLPMDPELYKGHKYNGWYAYLKLAKAMPLRYEVVINGMMLVTYTIAHVHENQINPKEFTIPKLKLSEQLMPAASPNETILKLVK